MSSREYRTVFVTIWTDSDFRNLSIPAQRLYFLMLTHPTLSPCGVIEWREPKLAAYAGTGDVMDLRKAAYELGAGDFIAVDPDTEEAVVRSYVRHDGTLKSPNMARGLVKAYGDVASQKLMAIISKEVRRAVAEHPEWKGAGSVGEVTKQFPNAESETFEMVPGWFDPTQPNPSGRVRSGFDPTQPNPSGRVRSGFDLGSISVRSELPPSGGEPFDLSSPNQNQNQNPSSNEEDTSATCAAGPTARRVTYPPAFEAFWDAYPKHKDKKAALKAWKRATKEVPNDTLVDAALAYATDENRDPQYTKHPATWLNAGAWDDQPDQPTPHNISMWDYLPEAGGDAA